MSTLTHVGDIHQLVQQHRLLKEQIDEFEGKMKHILKDFKRKFEHMRDAFPEATFDDYEAALKRYDNYYEYMAMNARLKNCNRALFMIDYAIRKGGLPWGLTSERIKKLVEYALQS